MRRWALFLGLFVAAAVAGLVIWHQTNRVHFVQTLCEAGLPNLSRPSEVDADVLGCAVLGPKRRVEGFAEAAFEQSSIVIGDRYDVEEGGFFRNETAWYEGGWGDATLPESPETCWLSIVRISVEGWMTETPDGFGHLDMWPKAFFAGRVFGIGQVTPEDVADFTPEMRKQACIWGGEQGWVSLAATQPAS